RAAGVVRGRQGARRLAVTNAGTIPDRGLYGVFIVEGGGRVGELDEEMVYEARAGQVIMLGASSWRIEEITRDRVLVSPAPGVPGAVPFWKGEGVGRPYELGRAIGEFSRILIAKPVQTRLTDLANLGLSRFAAQNLSTFLEEQQRATGVVPSDRSVVVERFRENAARALLIPRRRPGERTPLWQQRLKAQGLLQVARKYASFPIVLETYRECLQDVFDLPALKQLLHGLRTRELDLVDVESASASPFAASLLFDYIATYMYEDDTPPAERRAQALSLDRDLLRELLGQEELRELIDA